MDTLVVAVDGGTENPAFRAGMGLALVVATVLVAVLATSPPADIVLPLPIAPAGG